MSDDNVIDMSQVAASARIKTDAEILRDAILEQGRAIEDLIAVLRGAIYEHAGPPTDERLRDIQVRIWKQREEFGA